MHKTLAIPAICLAVSLAFAAAEDIQPLKVKTGLWDMNQTTTWTGLPPQFAAMMKSGQTIHYKSCVKPKDLITNPWADGSGEKCSWKVLNSTGTDMEVQSMSCDLGKNFGMTAATHGKIHVIDSENGTGTFDITLTGNGQTMNGHASYTGKWSGPTCPANTN